MGRPAAFELRSVIRAAREVFWQRGYEAASIAQIEEAAGIARSSIYHVFGSKRGLFIVSLRSYVDEVLAPGLEPLTGRVERGAIVDYMKDLRTTILSGRSFIAVHGSMLINVSSGSSGGDPDVGSIVRSYLDEQLSALCNGIRARFPRADGAETARLAQIVQALLVSALTLVRLDKARAGSNLDAVLALLGESASEDQAPGSEASAGACSQDGSAAGASADAADGGLQGHYEAAEDESDRQRAGRLDCPR